MKNKKIKTVCDIIIFFMLLSLTALCWPASVIAVGAKNKNIIYHGNTNSNKVCLMINVYWGTEYIDGMLQALKQFGFKTTFFVGGTWVSKNADILMQIVQDGHEIGNHGFHHKDHDKLSDELNKKEIEMTHKLVLANAGVEMNLFAPPSGAVNDKTVDIAAALGYKTIMWTRDTIDWRDKRADLVFNRAVKNILGGDLILMHPTAHTLQALPKILAYIQNNNLVAATVTDCLTNSKV